LPQTWIDEHVALEKRILERERSLGMTPILQGFTGHAPKTLEKIRSDVKLVKLMPWCGFPSTYKINKESLRKVSFLKKIPSTRIVRGGEVVKSEL
jgi:hypothetical protein